MIYLEPREILDPAIIDIFNEQIVYDYHLLAECFAKQIMDDFKNEYKKDMHIEDAMDEAIEWIQYNVISTLCNVFKSPIIVSDILDYETVEKEKIILFNNKKWELII